MPPLTSQHFDMHTKGPSSTVTDSASGLSLRKPKCLVEYERSSSLPAKKDMNDSVHLVTSNMIDKGSQLPRQPSPLDKLSTYRRLRSQTQPKFSNDAAPVDKDHCLAAQDAPMSETEKSAQPVFLARLPKEMMGYIVDLEDQNRQLRQQVVELQEELQKQQRQGMMSSYRKLADTVIGNSHRVATNGDTSASYQAATNGLSAAFGPTFSQEERERYMNDVLAQVDVIVQAHRNQTEAMILEYKQEAESAKLALKQLREAVTLEGVDLSMLPVALATINGRAATAGGGHGVGGEVFKKTLTTPTSTEFDAGVSGIAAIMNEKCSLLVSEAVDMVLGDLLRVEATDDVPEVVRQSVQRGFEGIARHLAGVVANYIGHCTGEVRYLHKEREVACRELREELSVSESQRLRMAQRYETEIRALRDELHAFYVAAANGDELKASILERALEEYSALLVNSRKEAESLRSQLEEERSNHATTCLRLKASLQRHSSEFEEAIMRRADEIVRQRDERIAELQQQMDTMRQAEAQRMDRCVNKGTQTQAVEPIVLDESNYVANLLSFSSSWKGGSPALSQRFATPTRPVGHSTVPSLPPPLAPQPPITSSVRGGVDSALQPENSFEEEVWAKTMELLTKYGNISQN